GPRMQLFGQILVNGILLGGLYGLMGLGMGLVWGVLKIVNLAHGALIMLGGYALYFLYTKAGIDPFLGLPLAMLILFVLGYLLQVLLLNLIVRSAQLNTLLLTFGLDVVFVYMAQLLFTADFRTINPPYAGKNVSLAGVTVPTAQLGAFGVAVLLAALPFFLLGRARPGPALRAAPPEPAPARAYRANPHPGDAAAVRGGGRAPAGGGRAGRRGRRTVRHRLADYALHRRDADGEVLRDRHPGRPRQPAGRGRGRAHPRGGRGDGGALPGSDVHRHHQLRPARARPGG